MIPHQTRPTRAPQRPRAQHAEYVPTLESLDLSNPKHPAGTDPRNVDALMRLEGSRRGRHANTLGPGTPGGKRWPLQ